MAEKLVATAEQAEAKGDTAQARDLYLRAAAVYRIARFPINRSPVSQEAWEGGKAAYVKGGQYLSPPSVPVDISFTRADESAGDRNVPIQAYLRLPAGKHPANGWPLLLLICGLDAYKTDHTPRTQTHVDHGFATLSCEIPGTGDSPAAPNDPTSPDRLMSSILDWVAANAANYSFDLIRIVARGISTGRLLRDADRAHPCRPSLCGGSAGWRLSLHVRARNRSIGPLAVYARNQKEAESASRALLASEAYQPLRQIRLASFTMRLAIVPLSL